MKSSLLLALWFAALCASAADSFQIIGTNVVRSGTNWVGGGVDAFDQNGIQAKGSYPIKIIREVVQDISECPIYSTEPTLHNALGYLHPLQDVVNYNHSNGVVTILCPFGWDAGTNRIFAGLTPSSTYYYTQFKQRLAAIAQAFTNMPDVWIDVWNEPYAWDNTGFTESQWLSDMNDLYNTIRQAGNTNIILIPGQANDSQETVLIDQKGFLAGKYNVLACIHCYNGWTLNSQANDKSRIQSIRAAGWALMFSEVGRDQWSADCTRVLSAGIENQVTSLAWSWGGGDGSAVTTNFTVPTDWGNQFFPYLPLFVPAPGAPPAPASLAAGVTNNQIVLTWMPAAGATSYTIKRSTIQGKSYSVVASGLSGYSYTDSSAAGGTPYHYIVTATNNSGESTPSSEAVAAAPVICIVDDADSAGVTIIGAWTASSYTPGYYGTDYLHDGNTGSVGGKSVRFTPNLPAAGAYNVYARWISGSNRATNAPIDVNYAGGTVTFLVNQQNNNGTWMLLSNFTFNAGTSGSVVVRNDGANGYVVADAVEFVSTSLTPRAPSLAAIPSQTILAGRTMLVTNTLTDPNLPSLALAYRLLAAPAGSSINTNTGIITWRPSAAQGNTTNQFTVNAFDTGTTGLGATQQFAVTVLAPAQPAVQKFGVTNQVFTATVSGDSGPDYSILVSTNLISWTPLLTTNSPAMPFTFTDPAAANYPRRFYRIQLGP